MIVQFDHVALVVHDLPAAIADFEALGFAVVFGGAHPTGSHVAFMAFDDGTSLELFSFQSPAARSAHRYGAKLEEGEGLVDWCVGSDGLARDVATCREIAVSVGDPLEKGRTRPDGRELRWRVAITSGPASGQVPFLIEDETPRSERVPPPGKHPNGACAIEELRLASADLDLPRRWCERMLPAPATTATDGSLEARVGSVKVTWNLRPDSPPGLVELRIRSRNARDPVCLDPARTHGARILL